MQTSTIALILLAATILSFELGRWRSRSLAQRAGGLKRLHSLPRYHGALTALWCGVPALIVLMLWFVLEPVIVTHLVVADLPEELRALPEARLGLVLNDIRNTVAGTTPWGADPAIAAAAEHYRSLQRMGQAALVVVVLSLLVGGASIGWRQIAPPLRARNRVETAVRIFLILCSLVAIFTTLGIVLSVLFEALRFFRAVPVTEFLFGLNWSPQTAMRPDQVGSSGAFGAVPLFAGTLLISAIAMLVAVPVGLLSAIYLSEYAHPRFRGVAKPLLEVLAGIPTVVYGFFAALTVAPLLRDAGDAIGIDVASESALAAGLVMGIMIIPFVSSLSDDVLTAVPRVLREGSLGLGATRSETIRKVIFPAALPGIVGGILLAVSRAIGETMIVVMAAGLAANLTANPLEAVTTVTVQIVTLLVGDQEFDSPKTLAAFALGLVLFVMTLLLNILALHIVRRYREQYE
ncbi:phosphate ABC transporter permease subunit PstC [soil metagenome]